MSQAQSKKTEKVGVPGMLGLAVAGAVLGGFVAGAFSRVEAAAGLGLGLGVVFALLRRERARSTSLFRSHAEMLTRVDRLERTIEDASRVPPAQREQQTTGGVPSTSPPAVAPSPFADATPADFPEVAPRAQVPSLPPMAPPFPRRPPSPPTPNAFARGINAVRAWLFGGNTVVRAGVLVLLVGITLLARWAAEHSLFPIEARLASAALIGVGLVGVGFRLRTARPSFGTTLQGGGLAALYLVAFMAFRIFDLVPVGLAFVLFAVIAAAAGMLAVLQRALPLIVIASLGGFLAPVLASTGSGNHVALFSYYLVLNLSIASIAFMRSWRVLNLLAFVCTYGVATAWGVLSYQPEQLASTMPFVFAFLFLFTGEALLFAWRQPPNLKGIVDATLVFGTPLVSLLALASLLKAVELALAIATAGMALVYAGIAVWLWRTAPETLRQLSEAFIALAVGLATMAVPFAFEDSPTTAIVWALEGAGVHWIGVRQSRRLARVTGLALQPLAAVAFAIWLISSYEAPTQWLANSRFLSALALTFAGLTIAREADRVRDDQGIWFWAIAQAAGVWGLAWWGWGAVHEFEQFLPDRFTMACEIGLLGASTALLHWGAQRVSWESGRTMGLLSIPLAAWALAQALESQPSLLAAGGFVAWPLCLAAIYWVIHQLEDSAYASTSYAYAPWLWLSSLFVGFALYGLADRSLALGPDWGLAGIGIGLGGVSAAALHLIRRELGAFGRFARIHFTFGVGPILIVGLLWVFGTNFAADGAFAPLAYLPLLNPIDLTITLIAVSAGVWALRLASMESAEALEASKPAMRLVAVVLAFCWMNAVLTRSVVQWTGVAHRPDALWDSISLQVCLSIAWTLVGVAGMWFSTRQRLRKPWMAFAGLLAITVIKLFVVDLSQLTTPAKIGTFLVVGVLLLIVGYLSPVPPEEAAEAGDAGGRSSEAGAPGQATRTSLIWIIVCFATISTRPASAQSAAPLSKDDFAWSRAIETTSRRVIQGVELPYEIYRDSVEPGLADLRVFDAAGVAVPHAIAAQVVPKSTVSTLTSLPLFRLPDGKSPSEILVRGGRYRVDVDIDGERATLALEPDASNPSDAVSPRAYIIDASSLHGEVAGLELDLAPQSEDFLVPLRVEATGDFVAYRELTAAAVVAQLAGATDQIERRRVEFRRSRAKYLRISWPANEKAPTILGVRAVQRAPERTVKRLEAAIEGDSIDSGSYRYDLGGWPPIDQIQVDLAGGRALVSAEVYRADQAEGPWRQIHRGIIYRLGVTDDQESHNEPIELTSGPARFIRIDVASKGGDAWKHAPTLRVAWPPEQLYFIDQGGGPHTLVYGKLGAPAARFEAPKLMAISRRVAGGAESISPTAVLGPRVALRGAAALEPESGYPIRTLILWAVLLGSVAIVAFLALRLVREMRE